MSTRQGSQPKKTTSEASLLEQVKLLTIENQTLRTFIAAQGYTKPLPKKSTAEDDGTEKRRRRGSKSPNFSNSPGTPQTAGKGCSCKGNCSTRVCGCVKKNLACAEFCRCGNELCQNSEADKENIGDPYLQPPLSKDGTESLRKLSKLTLADNNESKKKSVGLNPANKPRSIFSPEVTDNVLTFQDGLDEVEFENLSLRFAEGNETEAGGSAEKDGKGSGAKKTIAEKSKKKNNKKKSDEEANDFGESEPGKKTKQKVERKKTAAGAAGKQINRVDSKKKDEAAQDNEHSESPSPRKRKIKAENKGKANAATFKRNNISDSEETDEEASQENENTEPKLGHKNQKKAGTKATDSKQMKEVGSRDNEHYEPEPANKNKNKAGPKVTGASGKRNNRMDLEEKDEVAAQDSEHSESDSVPVNKNKKKAEKRGKATVVVKKRYNRIYFEDADEASQDNEHWESQPEPANKTKNQVSKKAMATGATGKRNNQVHRDEMNEEESQDTEDSESEPEPTFKINTRTRGETANTQRGREDRVEMGESSSKNGNHVESDTRKKTENGGEKGTIAQGKGEKNHQRSTTKADEGFGDSANSELSPTGSETSSNGSVGTDNMRRLEVNEVPENFNPMKPRRQLSRSPLGSRSDSQPQRLLDPSEILLPIPPQEDPEEEVPPPAELEKVIVDWDEHLAILVECSKCTRTFHPHRIKKHEAFCQNI